MDTDWCIVCDTRISPRHGAPWDNHEDEEQNKDQSTESTIDMPFSAFCSQDCLIKSYIEAASQVRGPQQLQNNTGRTRLRRAPDNDMLYPGHPKKKSSDEGHLVKFSSNNPKYFSLYPGRKEVVSKFTLNSCGSTSSTSSSSSSWLNYLSILPFSAHFSSFMYDRITVSK